MRTGERGFGGRSVGGGPPPRAPLAGPTGADVAIVGAGFTGLWTAYYLKRARPSLRVLVLEAEQAGFGASGRNGGWVSGFFSGPPRAYARGSAVAPYEAMQRAMFATVPEIAAVPADHAHHPELDLSAYLTVALPRADAAPRRAGVASA